MQVEFHFDFASPNAYLAHRLVPTIEVRTGARFRYIPILLDGALEATGNRPLELAHNKLEYERLETERFIRRHRIEGFQRNPFLPMDTTRIMAGAAAAEIDGGLNRYVNAIFHHMWEAPKPLNDPDAMADALTASGLDADTIMARTVHPDVNARLSANTQLSIARGTFDCPTFFVGDAIFFGKDRLRDVEDAIHGIA